MNQSGLDAAFLDFIRQPDPEVHRRIHGYYLQFFTGCRRVVDLACGQGVFVSLLVEAGYEALGVDADPGCVTRARAAGLPVEQAEVQTWLTQQPDGSLDGVFNAHLVEHLPYPDVLALYRQAHRVLRPGGILVTVTPNVRSLYSHLEMFYQHFGHETFYHPRLLAFFAHQAGFAESTTGENPRLAAPLFGQEGQTSATLRPVVPAPPPRRPGYRPLPRRGGLAGGLWWRCKMALVRLLVLPLVDSLVAELHQTLAEMNADRDRLAAAVAQAEARATEAQNRLAAVLARLDRPFEAYVVSRKGQPSE